MAPATLKGESGRAVGDQAVDAVAHPRATPLPEGLARLSPIAWLIFLAGGLTLAIVAAIAGDATAAQPWLTAFGFVTTAAILVGVHLHQPTHRVQWLLLAACDFLTTVGVALTASAGGLATAGQGLTALGSALGFVGFGLLARGRIPSGDRAALLDAAIVATGAGILIWAFGLAPYVLGAGQTSIVTAFVFFPSLVALALVARMWFLGGEHRPVTRLIALNVLTANGIILVEIVRASLGTDAYTGVQLLLRFLELAFTGAAALHPAMDAAVEHRDALAERIGRGRFVALAFALLVGPATLAIEASSRRPVDITPYAIGGVLIGLLVIARLGEAIRTLGEGLRERESLTDQLRHMAFYDPLTGLPNRTLFSERLTASVGTKTKGGLLATLMIDLDDFKVINDTHGHEVGDALLVAVGERLQRAVRDGDTVARLGGDEFVIALPDCADRLVAIQVGRRILKMIAEPFEIDGLVLEVAASVGIAMADESDDSASELVRKADVAMYVAKGRGKGRFDVFEPSMAEAAR
jgi:diguanylate cyclase (GGDEF)-like protein